MASMPHGRLGPPLWSFAADAHDCIMVLVRLDRPHTSSWRDAARPWAGSPQIVVADPTRCAMSWPSDRTRWRQQIGGKVLDRKSPIQVRGSGPAQSRALEARCHVLVFPIPSLDRRAIPLLRPSHPSTASRSRRRLPRRNRSSTHATSRQQSPDNPSHLVGQRDPHQHRWLAGQHAAEP
jgi:hypothetical protein